MRRTTATGILLLLVLAQGGCLGRDTPAAYTVRVALDETMRDDVPSISVDIVGVWAGDAEVLDADYAAGRMLREARGAATVSFRPADAAPKELARSDAAWSIWLDNGATDLLIVVDFLPGTEDPARRRLVLPLKRGAWVGDVLNIRLMEASVRCLTPRRFEE